ncbi:NAD+ synthase [Dehalococcoidia bacterium]|nr:NAD+ synthase [Dehalococcoidia bacterium]
MRTIRIALAQFNMTVGDLTVNSAKIVDGIHEAQAMGADLVLFPELAIPGYPPEDLILKPQFIRENRRWLDHVVPTTAGITAVVGFVESVGDKIYNAAAIAHDCRLVDVYHKVSLPTYGVFDEDRYFVPGDSCPVHVINGTPVGVNICEDIWYDARPTVAQTAAGAQVIVNISGSPCYSGRRRERESMLAERAVDNDIFIAYLNLVGGQDELVFDGGSMVFDPEGRLIAAADQFEEQMLIVDLDVGKMFDTGRTSSRMCRENVSAFAELGSPEFVHVSDYDAVIKQPVTHQTARVYDGEAEVYAALVLGTRDYVRKCGFEKVLVALSGGIDSSLVATVAVDALGNENVMGISMPSRFSSGGSVADARLLADSLGIELWTLPIEDAFSAYLETLSDRFDGTEWGVAEENIQSRIRGNLIMALSNKFGWLVLTTGNKSEMATGYATIYGDMSGGFGVIKDVPKVMCYRLAEYLNRHKSREVIPASVIAKPPSAELRPDQRDQDNLPPYETLDPILKAYVEDDLGFEEIVGMGFDGETVKGIITLVDRSEYKRRQAAPGIKITPRNFGRDRRMPIANGYRPF